MADEKKETDPTAKSADAATESASTLKKVSAKKKTTTKKVAKKKAVTKKTVTNKSAPKATNAQSESKAVPPTVSKSAENKPATATSVAAAASSMTSAQPAQAEINIQVKPKKKASPEEPSMSTGAKSSSGFWVKVLFWLVILVLGFIYIRSLAKNPVEQGAATAVQTETPAASSQAAAGTMAPAHSVKIEEKTAAVDQAQNGAKATSTSSQDSAHGSPADDQSGMAKTASAEPPQAADSSDSQTAGSGGDAATSGVRMSADNRESVRDERAESVSKILKEFDDLREAAQAEMEAMHNLMQAERELHEAMAAPPPAAYPPAWRGPAYSPYATGPQYSPYTRP